MRTALALKLMFASLIVFCGIANGATSWKSYSIAEHGFSVKMPSVPQSRLIPTPGGEGTLWVYEAIDPETKLIKYSVFVNEPERGIFDADSIEAFLTGYINSLVQAADSATLRYARRTMYQGQPAMEYAFDHSVEGVPYVARGIAFMIDGGYMRVSVWHPKGSAGADDDFERFRRSFSLSTIAYRPVRSEVSLGHGVYFRPPIGWKRQPSKNAAQLARYTHLTRSMQVMVASDPAYTCATFEREVSSAGKLRQGTTISLEGQPLRKLVTFEEVPKYNVRLTTVLYCQDSRLGATVLGGSEEESKFERWSRVFEGAAATLRVR